MRDLTDFAVSIVKLAKKAERKTVRRKEMSRNDLKISLRSVGWDTLSIAERDISENKRRLLYNQFNFKHHPGYSSFPCLRQLHKLQL